MVGRPSEYTEEIAGLICERLMDGQSLRSICLADDMPSGATVFRWLADPRYENFRDQYARAREAQADAMADEILDIADDGTNDYVERERPDGSKFDAVDSEHIQRSRLRVEARKWLASKLLPKKYGDKQLIGSDPENPLPQGFQVNLVKRGGDDGAEAD